MNTHSLRVELRLLRDRRAEFHEAARTLDARTKECIDHTVTRGAGSVSVQVVRDILYATTEFVAASVRFVGQVNEHMKRIDALAVPEAGHVYEVQRERDRAQAIVHAAKRGVPTSWGMFLKEGSPDTEAIARELETTTPWTEDEAR